MTRLQVWCVRTMLISFALFAATHFGAVGTVAGAGVIALMTPAVRGY